MQFSTTLRTINIFLFLLALIEKTSERIPEKKKRDRNEDKKRRNDSAAFNKKSSQQNFNSYQNSHMWQYITDS